MKILDVGCGRWGSPWEYDTYNAAYVVGVDIDQAALAENPRINEAICADIHTLELSPQYDVVLCWDMLEHLADPEPLLHRLCAAVAPGGAVILNFPNVLSPKAVLAKLTPHRFHVWCYRRILGQQEAGQPGHGPFRLYLSPKLRRGAFRRMAVRAGLVVSEFEITSPDAPARALITPVLRPFFYRSECRVELRLGVRRHKIDGRLRRGESDLDQRVRGERADA